MKRIGIITNDEKDKHLKYTKILLKSIIKSGGKANIMEDSSGIVDAGDEGITCCASEQELFDNSDIIVCLGGDGTFLKVARKIYKSKLPILGINLGNLGFLTEVEKNDINNAVGKLVNGEYEIEERMMIETEILSSGRITASDVAVNDVVISRGALSRILHLKTYINNSFIDFFPGDGLIISTPTGSTAYSLSAGGPIVEPGIDLMIVTPICPHILYSRSFITAGDGEVRIVIDESYGHSAMVTVDGQEGYEVKGGDIIKIKKAEHNVRMVKIGPRNFFNILRTKIYDRGESFRKNEV